MPHALEQILLENPVTYLGDYTMKFATKTLLAAALSSVAFAASAMTPMQDESLSQVSGQDGVSIAANLNVNIGSFVYKNTDAATGGSVSFNNIKATGLIAATLDVINAAAFTPVLAAVGVTGTFYDGKSDVVRIAVPDATALQINQGGKTTPLLSVSVDSIRMGNSTASYGSFAMNNIDMRGTTAWIWAH
jgi:hypothetical protein